MISRTEAAGSAESMALGQSDMSGQNGAHNLYGVGAPTGSDETEATADAASERY